MLLFFLALLGLAIGSFLNVVVLRLKSGEPLGGRSHCPGCGKLIAWYHNLPLVSFVALRGRCASCRQPISWQYPLVEFVCAALFVLAGYLTPLGDWLMLLTSLVFVSYGLALFVFDIKFQLLPDQLTLSGAAALLVLNLLRGVPLASLAVGALAAAGLFGVQYLMSRGRWIGAGDVRLGLFMGLGLGWPQVAVAVVLAYWSGAIVGLTLVVWGRSSLKSHLPFGAFLVGASLVAWWWGDQLLGWYLRTIGA